MSYIKDLDAVSIRDYIDVTSLFEIQRDAEHTVRHNFSGSMKFEKRGKAEYLIFRSKGGRTQKSLGPRNENTERICQKFTEGKKDIEDRLKGVKLRISDFRRVMKAHGMGRLPDITGRVLRKFDEIGWLGQSLIVIGANAIYGYEAKAGVRVQPEVVATEDLDILYDTRGSLTFSGQISKLGFIGVLQTVDKSFQRFSKRKFSAVNKDGFVIDLLEPQDHQKFMHDGPTRMSDNPDDLIAVATDSSKWLFNTPKFESVIFDQNGYPLRMVALDPRVYALQKLWIAKYDQTRDRSKKARDSLQTNVVATIADKYLGLKFDSKDLSGLPKSFRNLVPELNIDNRTEPFEWSK